MSVQDRNDLLRCMEEGGKASSSDSTTATATKGQNASNLLVSFALISLTAFLTKYSCMHVHPSSVNTMPGGNNIAEVLPSPRSLVDSLGRYDVSGGDVAWDTVGDAAAYEGENAVGMSTNGRPNQPMDHPADIPASPRGDERAGGISNRVQGGKALDNNSLVDAGDISNQRRGETALGDLPSGADNSGGIAFQSSQSAAEPSPSPQGGGKSGAIFHQENGETAHSRHAIFKDGSTVAHQAAKSGNVDFLRTILTDVHGGLETFSAQDSNGWQPLHEAAKRGYVDIVNVLAEHGVDLNSRTNSGRGGSALWWAEMKLGPDHPVCTRLRTLGAARIEPDDSPARQQ